MDRQPQQPIFTLILVKVLLLAAFIIITQSSKTNYSHSITIGNPPFTDCERLDIVADYQSSARLTGNTL